MCLSTVLSLCLCAGESPLHASRSPAEATVHPAKVCKESITSNRSQISIEILDTGKVIIET